MRINEVSPFIAAAGRALAKQIAKTIATSAGVAHAPQLNKDQSEKEKEEKQDKKTDENFANGKKKGKSRPGRVKKAGASCKGSVTDLRAKAKKYSGEKGKMYHWCANMKGGKK